jgi:hypothetical protein
VAYADGTSERQALVAGKPVGWEGPIVALARGKAHRGEVAQLARVTASLHTLLAERLGVARDVPVPGAKALPSELGGAAELWRRGVESVDPALQP